VNRDYSSRGALLSPARDKSRQQQSGYRPQARTTTPRLTTHPQSAHVISICPTLPMGFLVILKLFKSDGPAGLERWT